jgi:putative ABC transport system ATP-binding protein
VTVSWYEVCDSAAEPMSATDVPVALLELGEVERVYPGSPPIHAVRRTTLRVDAGDYVSLMGRSGSGKSTLLNLIGLLDKPTAGEVRYGGLDTSRLPDHKISALRGRYIGFVFQGFNLLAQRTASENAGLSLIYQGVPLRQRSLLAEEALGRVGLAHRVNAFPNQLSGGEQQRVAIARALAGRPEVLLCDEPTGNLDVGSAGVVLDLLGELNSAGLAIVLVTHDPTVAARAHRHLTMADGIATETPAIAGSSDLSAAGSSDC